jgi:hypothetical protein
MRRLFRAGLVAASAQILAVAVATVALTIALRRGLVTPASGAAESELQSAVRLLPWIDLVLAVGIALTRTGSSTRPLGEFVKQRNAFIRPRPIVHAKLFSLSCGPLLPALPFLLFARPPAYRCKSLTRGDGARRPC